MNLKKYNIQVLESSCGRTIHMKVSRIDGKSGISWDTLMQIKNEMLGPETLAVEVYPPQHEVVNEGNIRHLWTVDPDLIPSLYRHNY